MTENRWCWGIDVSTKCVALAVVHDDYRQLRTLTIASCANEPARRGAVAYSSIRPWARSIAASYPPLVVWIEAPTGRHPNPELGAMFGIVRSAVWAALADLYPHPVDVLNISVNEWRKESIGFGNANKTQIVEWARSLGVNPSSEDEAEALGIAVAGQAMLMEQTA